MIINRQFILFLSVGCMCAVVDVSTMQLLILVGSHYGMAVSVGFFVGLVLNYAFHANLTFKASTSISSLGKFLIVAIFNYLITLIFVFVSFRLIDNAMLGKLMSLPVIAVNGFLLSKFWVFK